MLFIKSVLALSLAIVTLAAPVTQPRQALAGGLVAELESAVDGLLNGVDITLSGSAERRQADVNVGLVPVLESTVDDLLNDVGAALSGLDLA